MDLVGLSLRRSDIAFVYVGDLGFGIQRNVLCSAITKQLHLICCRRIRAFSLDDFIVSETVAASASPASTTLLAFGLDCLLLTNWLVGNLVTLLVMLFNSFWFVN